MGKRLCMRGEMRRGVVQAIQMAFLLRKPFHRAVVNTVVACLAFSMMTNAQAQQRAGMRNDAHDAVVSLPMYEVSDAMKKADNIFWSRLRERLVSQGIDAPLALERTDGDLVDQWQGEHLLLSQTCGYPYTHTLMQRGVKIVGTPVYTTNDGLAPGQYRSVVIVKAGTSYRTLADLKGKKAGVNDMGSNSGMNAFRAAVASSFSTTELKRGIFGSVTTTGGHMNSVRMVADGRIDVAAIDSVSYDLIKRDYPELAAKTRVLMDTPVSPGLPLITSAKADDATIDKMRSAIKEVVTHPGDAELRWALGEMKLKDFVVIDAKTYHQRIYELEDSAADKGYAALK
jgi:ABC-type phosphate/phosphonate transport system substrate-binding protein